MEASNWNKIKKNWNEVIGIQEGYVRIIRHLYSGQIIDGTEKDKVQTKKIKSEKMEELLNILRGKQNSFEPLMQALKKDHPWLEEKIRTTPTDSDPLLTCPDDSCELKDAVREVLLKYLANVQGAETELSEIREILKREGVFGGSEWKNKTLEEFLKTEFVYVEIDYRKLRKGKNAKKVTYVKNIAIKDPASQKQQQQNVDPNPEGRELVPDIREMNPSQLKEYLRQKMIEQGLPTSSLDDLEREQVSGQVFLTMEEQHFKEIIPRASFGVRHFLLNLVSNNKLSPQDKTYPENLHKFDSEVKHTDKYVRGHCVNIFINVHGRKTTPLKNFHLISDQAKASEFIGSEVVPFASACLNNRRDGTIYFGISPSETEKHKAGEIVGVCVSKEEVQAEINDFLKKSFLESQQNLIASTVRDAKFVPVISNVKACEPNLWVIEIDIVSSYAVMQNHIIRTLLICLPIFSKKQKGKQPVAFTFSPDGEPKIMSAYEMVRFEADHLPQIVKQREEEEAEIRKKLSPDLRKQLLNLLTGGSEKMLDNVYPFLMTSPFDAPMTQEYIGANTSFIKHLRPKVVFDFDPEGSEVGIYKNLDTSQNEVMTVFTTDNFSKSKSSEEKHISEERISWVFCNGYDTMNISPIETALKWNKERKDHFEAAFREYIDKYDRNRIIFVICLFSKNYEILIEACDAILTRVNHWIVLADTEDTAKLWQEEMVLRRKIDKKELDRCITGMSWEHINRTILDAVGKNDFHGCRLSSSTGALVSVSEKKQNEWCNLDVLTAEEFIISPEEKERIMRESEEQFYRGEQVSWLNYWFHDQVLKRDIHEDLMQTVRAALGGKRDGERVATVSLIHEPGAGGTTSAKQVLWDLRKYYRCCVVRTITKETCDQLDELRNYQDDSPKPILILIDNEEEDKYISLLGNIEKRAATEWNDVEVYCTVILCERRASLPPSIRLPQIALRQALRQHELDWFEKKNKSLESKYDNPRFLISFNILRNGFKSEYISNVVKEFSYNVTDNREVILLKIVSLLNTYDPGFKEIPVSCLDEILKLQPSIPVIHSNSLKRSMNWEATLSEGVKVLLNVSTSEKQPSKGTLRVFHKIIAHEILERMKEQTGQKLSQIMIELLNFCPTNEKNVDSNKLKQIIKDVIMKREPMADGRGQQRFSKFITDVVKLEESDSAAEVLTVFNTNEDAYIIQLISRVYIDDKRWDLAQKYAEDALRISKNSYLWDTLAQVFKGQLWDMKMNGKSVSDDDLHKIVELYKECIEAFRCAQECCEEEETVNGEKNLAGYFGELKATLTFLSILKECPIFKRSDGFHRYLVDKEYKPDCFHSISEEDAGSIKSLELGVKRAIARLDSEELQMSMRSSILNASSSTRKFDSKTLSTLKASLNAYFQWTSDSDNPENNRRRAWNLGGTSLNSLFRLRQNKEHEKIKDIFKLIMKNINNSPSRKDLQTVLNSVTVLSADKIVLPELEYKTVLDWSSCLYRLNQQKETDLYCFEPFLYFVFYNFPTPEREVYHLCMEDLPIAVKKWQETAIRCNLKYAKEETLFRKREKVLFYLGKGSPFHDIVCLDPLRARDQRSSSGEWKSHNVRQQLRELTGSVDIGGSQILYSIHPGKGSRITLEIQTSHQVSRNMWNKRVYFYLGFTLSGPLAFGMSQDSLDIAAASEQAIHDQESAVSDEAAEDHPDLLDDLLKRLDRIGYEIEKNPDRKEELSKEYAEVADKVNEIMLN